MPPKVQKGKAASATALFNFNQQQKVPAPQRLHPLRCRRQQAILCCRGSFLVLSCDAKGRLHCDVLGKKDLEPEAVELSFQEERRPVGSPASVSVDSLRVTSIVAQDGKSLALVATESHGLLIAGYFDGEDADDDDDGGNFSVVKQLVPLRFAHQLPGSVLTSSSVVVSTAVAKSFCLAVVLDLATGTARVAGRGFTSSGALGKAPARSGSSATAALATMANVTFPKNATVPQQAYSAWEDSFAAFRWLTELDVLCVTSVFAGNSLALFNTSRGLYAMGKLSDQAKYEAPTLVLEWPLPGTVPLSIAFTDTAVYCLLQENTLFVLSPTSATFSKSTLLDSMPEKALTLRSGAEHVVAIGEKTHALYGFGNAAFGQLGSGNGPCKVPSATPMRVPVSDSETVVAVSCFGFRTLLVLQPSVGAESSEGACCFRFVGKV